MVFLSLTRLLFFSKTRRMLHILRIITFVFTIKFKTPTTNDVDKFKFCIELKLYICIELDINRIIFIFDISTELEYDS